MPAAHASSTGKQIMLAVTLSLVGGFTNAVTFIACNRTYTSHMTGAATSFGMALSERSAPGAYFYGVLLLAFLLGALASAAMTEGARLLGRKSGFVLPLTVEAILLCGLIAMYHHLWGLSANADGAMAFLASFAMGLQNATITKISGNVIRTTHLTGVMTDLGLEGMQYALWCWRRHSRTFALTRSRRILNVSRRHPTARRLLVLNAIFISFICGVVIATSCFPLWSCWALLLPIALLCALIVLDWRRPISEISAFDTACDPTAGALGLAQSRIPDGLVIYRLPARENNMPLHLPYVQHWVQRMSREGKIVVLLLPPGLVIRSSVIADLNHIYYKLHATGRALWVAGVSPSQYRILDRRGFVERVGAQAVHPDLEFAIACAASVLRPAAKSQASQNAIALPRLKHARESVAALQ
jgi:uncharacterized membrane protein YoaK (UPF0700 family)